MEAGSLDPDNQARYARKVVGWEDRLREHLDAHPELRRAQRREKVEGGVSAVERKRILKEAENRAKIENIRRQIRSDAVNKTLHRDAQGKHIPGHKNFIEGRSILTISMEEAQELVNRYAGTGEIRLTKNGEWDNQEIILKRSVSMLTNPARSLSLMDLKSTIAKREHTLFHIESRGDVV